MSVYADMSGDWLKNYANLLPEMLEDGVRVMIYAGNLDLICNWCVVKGCAIGDGVSGGVRCKGQLDILWLSICW